MAWGYWGRRAQTDAERFARCTFNHANREAISVSARVDHLSLFSGLHAVGVDELHAFAGDDRGRHYSTFLHVLRDSPDASSENRPFGNGSKSGRFVGVAYAK